MNETSNDLTYEQAEAILERMARAVAPSQPGMVELSEALAHAQSVRSAPAEPLTRRPIQRYTWTERTFRSLLESAPDALVIIDGQGTIVLVNSQTERLFGYRRAELLGQPIELLVPDHFRMHNVKQRAEYFVHHGVLPMGSGLEFYGRRKDGRDFPVEISLSPLETEEGLLVTSTIRDVSDRKRLEARYRTLVEGIPAVTFMAALDEGLNELYVSPQIEQLLGFSQKEWLEDPVLWYTRLHPEDRERWHIEFAQTCATAAPFRSTYRFIARDGRVVWVDGEAKVVRDNEGHPLFIQGVAFDITERKTAEEALLRAHDELEQLVHQRTAELANTNRELHLEITQRAAAQDSLSLALREKEALLKEIHHRVKNNLQVISSLLNLQSASIKDAATLQAFRESQNRVKSMALIHEKLYQSRDLARIDFGQYVRELTAYLFRSFGVRASEVRLRVEIDELSFSIDTAIPCGLIVTELVSNCLKHAFPPGTPGEITVALHADQARHYVLRICDNGIGFPKELDFRNTDSLGLQLVNTLAEQLEATLEVESDAGTALTLRFPELLPR